MLLFHVNRDYNIIKEFYPRNPQLSISSYETSDNRICVSESVDGCFSAVYFGCNELQYSMYLNPYYDDNYNKETDFGKYAKFKLYIFDTKDIIPENLINYKELNDKKLVTDSLITKEYWIINQNINPSEILEIEVHEYEGIYLKCLDFESNLKRKLYFNKNIRGKITSCKTIMNNEIVNLNKYDLNKIIIFDEYFKSLVS